MLAPLADHLAENAPRAVRAHLLRAAFKELPGDLEAVRRNPRHIRKLQVPRAARVVAVIEDPELLADILEHETRRSIRAKVTEQPAWARVPHRRICAICRDTPRLPVENPDALRTLIVERAARGERLGTTSLCDHQLIETIRALPPAAQPDLWRTAFDHTLEHSPRAHIELAASRIPLDPRGRDGTPYRPWSGFGTGSLHRMLEQEHPGAELLLLAVRAGRIPDQWKVTRAMWDHALAHDPLRALSARTPVPLPAIIDAWDRLSTAARVRSLIHAGDRGELRELLDLLAAEDRTKVLAETATILPGIVETTLTRIPDLERTDRFALLGMLERRALGEYLLGKWTAQPEIPEIPEILTLYRERQTGMRLLVEQAGKATAPGEAARVREALVETLVRHAPLQDLLQARNPVGALAQRRIWDRLRTENAIGTFVTLAPEWTGTLPELLDTIEHLGDGETEPCQPRP